jgi:hypothetical protein
MTFFEEEAQDISIFSGRTVVLRTAHPKFPKRQ